MQPEDIAVAAVNIVGFQRWLGADCYLESMYCLQPSVSRTGPHVLFKQPIPRDGSPSAMNVTIAACHTKRWQTAAQTSKRVFLAAGPCIARM